MDLRLKDEVEKRTKKEIQQLFIKKDKVLSTHYFTLGKGKYHLVNRYGKNYLCKPNLLSNMKEVKLDDISEDMICKNCLKIHHNLREGSCLWPPPRSIHNAGITPFVI